MLSGARLVAFAASTDLARSHGFYGGALGLTRVESTPYADVYDAGGTTLRVTLVERPSRAPYTVLGWQIDDLDVAVAALRALGIEPERYPGLEQDDAGAWTAPGGARIAWIRDPDANVLSLQEAPPGERVSSAGLT